MIVPGRNANLVDYSGITLPPGAPTPVMTAPSDAYLAAQFERLTPWSPLDIAQRVLTLVEETDAWRRQRCLNLNAAENCTSRTTRRLLDSDLATRVTEGYPGDKEFPPARQNIAIDEIEACLIHLGRRLFGVDYLEWRPVSTTMAIATLLQATTRPGDTILVQAMEGGGSMSYSAEGPPGWLGLKVVEIPPVGLFEFDLDTARALALAHRPKLIIVGGSYIVFNPDFVALRAIADEVGARLAFDAAHCSLYGATGNAPNPFAHGVDLLSASTHKILGGPVGGLVVTPDRDLARAIFPLAFPGFVQTRDQNKLAATAHALAEMVAFGPAYARQTIANARALAIALASLGYRVLGANRNYTETHQLFVDVRDLGAKLVETRCQDVGILFHAAHLPGDTERGMRTGLRLSVQEVTRMGLTADDMTQVADLIHRAVTLTSSPTELQAEVVALATKYPRMAFSFDA